MATRVTFCHQLKNYMLENGLADKKDSWDPECDYQLETEENCIDCGMFEILKQKLDARYTL